MKHHSVKGQRVNGLSIEGLTIRYGDKVAVDAVDLIVPTGTVLALVGASGCGKSTLLRSVAGLVDVASGDISWDATSITSVPTHQRDIGLMFQDHALFTHRSVSENIAFGLKMSGVDATTRRARVDELLALVGLTGFGERAVEGLSGGEAQRVALARALAPEPKLLLLDEPLASLDRARRIELNAELGRLLRELNQTAIYVTHDQDEAFALADQVGVMHEGKLLRIGTPAQVWRDPQFEIVARFVGHDAIVERNGERYAVRPDALSVAADSHGDVAGDVLSCSFQGDRYEVTVEIDGQPWRLFHHDEVRVGEHIALAVAAERFAKLD